MKKTIILSSLACLLSSGVPMSRAQGQGTKVKEDVKQTYHDTAAYLNEKKDDYIKRMQAELDDLDAKISELKAKVAGMGRDAKKKGEARLKALKRKRKAVAAKLAKVKSASDQKWAKLKAGADAAMDDLQQAYEDLKSSLK